MAEPANEPDYGDLPLEMLESVLSMEGGEEHCYVENFDAIIAAGPAPKYEVSGLTPEQRYGVWLDFEGGVEECYVEPGAPDGTPPAGD